jgi:hypothetical protein
MSELPLPYVDPYDLPSYQDLVSQHLGPEEVAIDLLDQLTAECSESRNLDAKRQKRVWYFGKGRRDRQPYPTRHEPAINPEIIMSSIAVIMAAEAILSESHGSTITLHPESDNPDMLNGNKMTG